MSSANVSWIKLYVSLFDNVKVRLIDAMPERDAIIVIWVRLLCLAGKTNDGGQIYVTKGVPFTAEMFATLFNRAAATVRLALKILEELKMIEPAEGGTVRIVNWERYQNTGRLEQIREQERLRKQRQRQRERAALTDQTDSHVTVTGRHDLEKSREEKTRGGETLPPESDSTSKAASKPAKIKHHVHGVPVGESRYQNLCAQYGASTVDDYIGRVANYAAAKGKRYQDYAAAAATWMQRDDVRKVPVTSTPPLPVCPRCGANTWRETVGAAECRECSEIIDLVDGQWITESGEATA